MILGNFSCYLMNERKKIEYRISGELLFFEDDGNFWRVKINATAFSLLSIGRQKSIMAVVNSSGPQSS